VLYSRAKRYLAVDARRYSARFHSRCARPTNARITRETRTLPGWPPAFRRTSHVPDDAESSQTRATVVALRTLTYIRVHIAAISVSYAHLIVDVNVVAFVRIGVVHRQTPLPPLPLPLPLSLSLALSLPSPTLTPCTSRACTLGYMCTCCCCAAPAPATATTLYRRHRRRCCCVRTYVSAI